MAKLTRVFQKIFGDTGDASHFGQFGSKALGAPFTTKDPNSIQSLTPFTNNGWKEAINTGNKAAFLEDMNGLMFLVFRQLGSIFQDGVPVWEPSTPYFTGSMVRKDGTFELYGSLVDNNVGNALPSQTDNGAWHFLNPPSVAPGIMSDFGGTAAPFGYLLCDGSVYAQASFPALFAAISTNWNTGGEGAGNFRVPDMRGRVGVGVGTGAGLTARSLAQTFGEETHALTAGESVFKDHLHSMAHQHILPVGINGAQVFFPATSGGSSWTPGGVTRSYAYWVQGVAGIGAATPLFYYLSDDSTNANTGSANSVGTGANGAGHNNMQPSAVVLKVIKI